tara:strand:- start:1682 stop:2335 length:654 start_codon:yes stop_codon:yes gene_type:complete
MPLSPELTEFTTQSPQLATYSYSEIASGSGIIQFYLYTATDDDTPTTINALTDQSSIYSNEGSSASDGTRSTGPALLVTKNFDSSPFNMARRAEGTATVNITIGARAVGGATGTTLVDVTLYRWDGTTATQIGDKVRSTTVSGTSTTTYGTRALNFTIPSTIFPVGEMIRVKVELYVQTSSGSSDAFGYFLHDPANRTSTGADTSTASLKLPFRIDL